MVVHKDDRGSLGQQQHVSQHSVGGGGVVSADQRLERPLEALQHLWTPDRTQVSGKKGELNPCGSF